MTSSLRGNLLGRWFEELCRVKHDRSLATVVTPDENRLRPKALPARGGVYAFWWIGPADLLQSRNQDLVLAGPGGRPVHLLLDDDWLGLSTGLPIPLYVGKNSASIGKRVGQHLLLGQL